ncbi:hypothetical protein D3C86_1439420 [compost metagenome]
MSEIAFCGQEALLDLLRIIDAIHDLVVLLGKDRSPDLHFLVQYIIQTAQVFLCFFQLSNFHG